MSFIHNPDVWEDPIPRFSEYVVMAFAMPDMVAKEELECRISSGMVRWDVCVARLPNL